MHVNPTRQTKRKKNVVGCMSYNTRFHFECGLQTTSNPNSKPERIYAEINVFK